MINLLHNTNIIMLRGNKVKFMSFNNDRFNDLLFFLIIIRCLLYIIMLLILMFIIMIGFLEIIIMIRILIEFSLHSLQSVVNKMWWPEVPFAPPSTFLVGRGIGFPLRNSNYAGVVTANDHYVAVITFLYCL